MPRLLFLSLLIFLVACSRGTTPAPASKPYTRPAPHDLAIAALIDQLVSNFPPHIWTGPSNDYDASDAERADYTRVGQVREKLESLGIKAFPDLAARSDDPRYSSPSGDGAAWHNQSVGDICLRIIKSHVDFWGYGYKSRDGANGRSASKPEYLYAMRDNPGLPAWWESHKTRSLRELQIESLQWTIQQETGLGFTGDAQRRQILDPLEKRLAELQSQPATPP